MARLRLGDSRLVPCSPTRGEHPRDAGEVGGPIRGRRGIRSRC
ncbi:hypothetical protein ACFPRL_09405 [Pseudoclavibacter helvolus]